MDNEQETQDNKYPHAADKSLARKELIEQLETMVDYFHRLPNKEKYSYATNADLYQHMILVVNILKICPD